MNTFESLLLPTVGSMRRELARAFSDRNVNEGGLCPLSVWKDDKAVYVESDVPGFRQEEIELHFEDGVLWIRGERTRSEHHPEKFYNERSFGKFERRIKISDRVEPGQIAAELENGVLLVTLPKTPEAQPHKIAIADKSTTVVENTDAV